MHNLTPEEQEAVCKRVIDLLNSEIEPKELAKVIRQGTYDLTMNILEHQEQPPKHLANVVYHLNRLSETLDPVML
jgi:hypothetical protein